MSRHLQMADLLDICGRANVLYRMGTERRRQITVDYVPAREAMFIPRLPDETQPIEPMTPDVIEVTFTLEDAMFGGVVFAAIVCDDRVVISPWQWISYEHLSKQTVRPVVG